MVLRTLRDSKKLGTMYEFGRCVAHVMLRGNHRLNRTGATAVTIEAMVRHSLERLKKENPVHPYFLFLENKKWFLSSVDFDGNELFVPKVSVMDMDEVPD